MPMPPLRTRLLLSILASAFPMQTMVRGDERTPTQRLPAESVMVLQSGSTTLSIDAEVGGRIESLSVEGESMLRTQRDANQWHWGSTVWVSPQRDWNWPPPPAFDIRPFTVANSSENRIELTSGQDENSGCVLQKFVESATPLEGELGRYRLTYRLTNRGGKARNIALWENTRCQWRGKVRVPAGSSSSLSKPDLPVVIVKQEAQDVLPLNAFQPNAQKIFFSAPDSPKSDLKTTDLFVEYILGDHVFRKQWKRPQNVAPEQSPIEIYFAPDDNFVELEVQGEYATLQPGDSIDQVVHWTVRQNDDGEHR